MINKIKYYFYTVCLKLGFKKYHSQVFNFERILKRNFSENDLFSFVQVGANDGVSHDSLFDFVKLRKAKGIVIEPVSDYYSKLRSNYSYNNDIIAVNKAVHPTLDEVEIYRVDPNKLQSLPDWANGIASLDSNHHKKSGIRKEYIITDKVPAETLTKILKRFDYDLEIDLVQIDVEGFDFEILKMLDFSMGRPKLIKYEHICLTEEDRRQSIDFLKQKNYKLFYEGSDIVAFDVNKIHI